MFSNTESWFADLQQQVTNNAYPLQQCKLINNQGNGKGEKYQDFANINSKLTVR